MIVMVYGIPTMPCEERGRCATRELRVGLDARKGQVREKRTLCIRTYAPERALTPASRPPMSVHRRLSMLRRGLTASDMKSKHATIDNGPVSREGRG